MISHRHIYDISLSSSCFIFILTIFCVIRASKFLHTTWLKPHKWALAECFVSLTQLSSVLVQCSIKLIPTFKSIGRFYTDVITQSRTHNLCCEVGGYQALKMTRRTLPAFMYKLYFISLK